MDKLDIWAWFRSETFQAALAGGLGGLVRWIAFREGFWSGVGGMVVGLLSAAYLGAAFIPLTSLFFKGDATDPRALTVSGFMVGIGGVVVVRLVAEFMRRNRK